MTSFTKNVVEIILSIPEGKVMSYGQIARAAGSPRAARQVVRILHSMSAKYNLPWHRVINSKGEIGFQDEDSMREQVDRLEYEGVEVSPKNKIDLTEFGWIPDRHVQ
ncbi:MGMT family protein [Falsibacillus pallidus]|uniref:Methylated-DNA-protein-cysteine methyltransferase-like protein n=1 Tax=Falsibacillus pallidus TaxID=493781 RepID=A0A370GQT4_9BACI|nr:MGMT family protein [Falsibacillus pallidus]RDI45769.1 methylated-DNA-protein-cysteine methyltransferase-like protein [Falsibacillus pallidus]